MPTSRWNSCKPLQFTSFESNSNPLSENESYQSEYLKSYLHSLQAESLIIEPNYFDRDYLSEFSSFYSTSARGYPNTCKRLHFFSIKNLDRELFVKVISGDEVARKSFLDSYLGFIILRPIPAAPFGRTVLRWMEDKFLNNKREIRPSRKYKVHLAGITMTVYGLAWQQQDSAVGKCSTVGLWTLLHSSAFDDHHAIPTTAEITLAANKNNTMGSRVFPSGGLDIYQLSGAIKECGLSPILISGSPCENGQVAFTKEHFSSTVASFIRSGYPVLLAGYHLDKDNNPKEVGHVICAVGFRDKLSFSDDEIIIMDSYVDTLYIHDDNQGPSVRYCLDEFPISLASHDNFVSLRSCPPDGVLKIERQKEYPSFRPFAVIAAVHNDMRLSPNTLYEKGLYMTDTISRAMKILIPSSFMKFGFSVLFVSLPDYIEQRLKETLDNKEVLSKVRLSLWENVPPMSLHLGVLRIVKLEKNNPKPTSLMDVIFDTTDSDANLPVFCHVVYDRQMPPLLNTMLKNSLLFEEQLGIEVIGF